MDGQVVEAPPAEEIPCPEGSPPQPAWVHGLTNPPPGAGALSGLWMRVDPRLARPGPLRRAPFCSEGFDGVALMQDGASVRATWIHRPGRGGAERRVEVHEAAFETGHVRGERVELTGYHVHTEERRDTYTVNRRCRPTRTELVLDPRTGHLRGTHEGVAITLAPVRIVTPPGFTCGPPPA